MIQATAGQWDPRDRPCYFLAADPSRAFVPRSELTVVTAYEVPVLAVLEDTPVKLVTIYQLR